jgi:hypothetical protein
MGKIKALFDGIWHLFKPVEENAVADFEHKIETAGPELMEIGVDAVKYVGTIVTGGGEAAREAAVEKIVADAKTAGIDLGSWAKNELNTLVELCYIAAKPSIAPPDGTAKEAAAE